MRWMGLRVVFLTSWTAGMACLAAADARVYVVDPQTSQVTVHVGKAEIGRASCRERVYVLV